MRPKLAWVKMPNQWIEAGALKEFRWSRGQGANNVAALMMYCGLVHFAEAETGVVNLTYSDFMHITDLSREKVARGLGVLFKHRLIDEISGKRSYYQILEYRPERDWAKFPAKGLYSTTGIVAFKDFNLRKRAELDAMKMLLLFASRRDRTDNIARISYDKITEMSGIPRENIKSGLNILAANGLTHVERIPSRKSQYGVANAYRLPYIDPHNHMGTRGRSFRA